MDLAPLLADLEAEHAALDERVAGLHDEAWTTPTPAEGWDVRDSISHLCFYDETARLAVTDPDAFRVHANEHVASFLSEGPEPDVAIGRAGPGTVLLERWRGSRKALLEALAAAPPGERVPWYGPDMGLASFTTARLMETWAHGQDVLDALGLPSIVSDRLRHVIHIGIGARGYAFRVHGVGDTGDPVRVEASAPTGERWSWGPDDAVDRIEGDALDLALVFTQRRHLDDTVVRVTGPTATAWMAIAQTFAGPAGPGRAPGLAVARPAGR